MKRRVANPFHLLALGALDVLRDIPGERKCGDHRGKPNESAGQITRERALGGKGDIARTSIREFGTETGCRA